ncbi:MAG: 1-acyl-sn-glycerol-3-phosphate acyltransferase [Silvanigrellaceae bacterium]|nr:1-acyl-sn-glycerol-3-phosphate acyltransferase [Silvanigrellaceae bacterium]
MRWIRFFYKILFFNISLVLFFTFAIITYLFCGFNINKARKYLVKAVSFGCILCLKVFGIKVNLSKVPTSLKKRSYLIACNHLSYTDIFIINKYFSGCFITSLEIKKTPYLGWICTLSGCLFVNRKNRSNIANEIHEISAVLERGLNIVFFPEATSTDGSSVINFKKSLFQAAVIAKAPVLPLCINYKTVDGNKVDKINRDSVFWYGDQSFFPHMVRFFSCKKIEVELSILEPIDLVSGYNDDKVILAETAYSMIKGNFEPVGI